MVLTLCIYPAVSAAPYKQTRQNQRVFFPSPKKKEDVWLKTNFRVYTRLPGQQTTVSVTLFLCPFSMGTNAEWLMPTVDRPFTATIMSPHLHNDRQRQSLFLWFWNCYPGTCFAGKPLNHCQRVGYTVYFERHLGWFLSLCWLFLANQGHPLPASPLTGRWF